MNWTMILLWAVAAAISLAVFCALVRGGRPVRGLVSSGLQGIGALVAVDIAGAFTGVSMGFNLLTIFSSVVLGVPGVIALLLLKTVFHIG